MNPIRLFRSPAFHLTSRSWRRIAPKALDKFKGRIRDMTRRTRGFSLQQLVKELKPYIMGWRLLRLLPDSASPHKPRSVDPSKIAFVSLAAMANQAKPLRGVTPLVGWDRRVFPLVRPTGCSFQSGTRHPHRKRPKCSRQLASRWPRRSTSSFTPGGVILGVMVRGTAEGSCRDRFAWHDPIHTPTLKPCGSAICSARRRTHLCRLLAHNAADINVWIRCRLGPDSRRSPPLS
jgi:hypothetical protein